MDLYRYLFAPALVAMAVLAGHHERRPVRPPPPAVIRAAAPLEAPGQGAPLVGGPVPAPTRPAAH